VGDCVGRGPVVRIGCGHVGCGLEKGAGYVDGGILYGPVLWIGLRGDGSGATWAGGERGLLVLFDAGEAGEGGVVVAVGGGRGFPEESGLVEPSCLSEGCARE